MVRWIVGITAGLLAALLHTFYVDYQLNADRYLISWSASDSQREAVIERSARSMIQPATESRQLVPGTDWLGQKISHIDRYCQTTEAYRRLSKLSQSFSLDPDDSRYFRCSRKFIEQPPEFTVIVTAGVDYATARERAESSHASPMRYGVVPSLVVAGDEPSRTSFVKSYWFGIVVPTALLALSLAMLIGAFRRYHSSAKPGSDNAPEEAASDSERKTPNAGEMLGPADVPKGPRTAQPSLADVLKTDLGNDFPVNGGNGKEDSPLVITATSDYVSVEYTVVRHMLNAIGEEYKLRQQALLNRDGRQIDMLVFDVKNAGAADWEGLRRFYFDITAGFGALR